MSVGPYPPRQGLGAGHPARGYVELGLIMRDDPATPMAVCRALALISEAASLAGTAGPTDVLAASMERSFAALSGFFSVPSTFKPWDSASSPVSERTARSSS